MLVATSVPSTSKNAPLSQSDLRRSRSPEIRVSVTAAAHEAQEEQEQVDEVEVERERAHQRVALLAALRADGAELLRVIGGEAGEDEHAAAGDDELHPVAAQEDVHDAGEDDPDQPDEEEAAPGGQVALGERAVEGEPEERPAGDEQGGGHRRAGVGEQHA